MAGGGAAIAANAANRVFTFEDAEGAEASLTVSIPEVRLMILL